MDVIYLLRERWFLRGLTRRAEVSGLPAGGPIENQETAS